MRDVTYDNLVVDDRESCERLSNNLLERLTNGIAWDAEDRDRVYVRARNLARHGAYMLRKWGATP